MIIHTIDAFNYLRKKGIKVKFNSKNYIGEPDLIAKYGKKYEVKYITRNGKTIEFTSRQIQNFKDNYIILIFKKNNQNPINIVKFGHIKKYIINNYGNYIFAISKIIKEVKLNASAK